MTARLIPTLNSVDEIELPPERDVCRALLAALPDECTVFHSYPWLRPERSDWGRKSTLWEGEADFLVFHPARGLLVIEVKGGDIVYRPDERIWARLIPSGAKRIKDPFEQARNNMHVIVEQITQRAFPGARERPFAFGYAVAFPNCDYEGAMPPGADPSILLSGRDMARLGPRVDAIFTHWTRSDGGRSPTREQAEAIRKALLPSFNIVPRLAGQFAAEEDRLVRLTRQQQVAMQGLDSNARVLVEGPAGSGKTMLALERARRFAGQGASTLFLCFNKGLAHWLADLVQPRGLTIRHFHGLAHDRLKEAGIPFRPPGDEQPDALERFWRDEIPERLMDAIDRTTTRYGAIVVDEAQDFHENWWTPIEMLGERAEQGPLYVFYDRHQNLFGRDLQFPGGTVHYSLRANCRNTQRIAAACGGARGVSMAVWKSSPVGDPPRIVGWETPDECRAQAVKLVLGWLSTDRLKPSQVAILGPHSKRHSCFASTGSVGSTPITDDLARWREGKVVLYSSIRGFKGLEADALVVVDVERVGAGMSEADLYVAVSRAKHELIVLSKSEDLSARLEGGRVTVVDEEGA